MTVEEMIVDSTVVVLLSNCVNVEMKEKRTSDNCVKVIVLVSNTGTKVVVVTVVDSVIVVIAPTCREREAVEVTISCSV